MNIHRVLSTIVHVLILVLLISFYLNNQGNRTNLVFILCATIIYICYLLEFVRRPNIMNLETFESQMNYKNTHCESSGTPCESGKKPFTLLKNYEIGPYSGLELNNDGRYNKYNPDVSTVECGMDKRPCNIGLHEEIRFDTPMGTEERYIPDQDHNKSMPSVTGNPKDPKSYFMFTHNQVHPDCCPSTYSTDRGCVCTTKDQREFINSRGNNRTRYSFPGI